MKDSPEAVLLYIPLMKELGMSWNEIAALPRWTLEGILTAWSQYEQLHAYDGYDSPKDLSPEQKAGWQKAQLLKRKYYGEMDRKRVIDSFKNITGG